MLRFGMTPAEMLETSRLRLTPLTLADAPRTQEIFPHWEIVRYLAAHVPNEGSRRISAKTGLRLVETTEKDYVSGRHPSEVWEMTASEWASSGSSSRGEVCKPYCNDVRLYPFG